MDESGLAIAALTSLASWATRVEATPRAETTRGLEVHYAAIGERDEDVWVLVCFAVVADRCDPSRHTRRQTLW